MKKRVLRLMLATVMCMALAVTANAVEYESSVLSVEQTLLINGNFPKNVRGETYGTALMAAVVKGNYELVKHTDYQMILAKIISNTLMEHKISYTIQNQKI